MTQRYIDLAFDDIFPRSFGGFDNENEATVIRLKVLDPDAKYYIEIEQACGKHDKYCSDVLPVDDGYAVFEVSRDFTHETLYVQGVMKVNGMCRKTARVRVGFSHSINALDELPESQPSWADSVDERIDGLEMGMKDAVLYTPQTLTEAQQKQARANIGALDINIETTPVDTNRTFFGVGKNIVYVKNGWLKPCPADADKELAANYANAVLGFGFINLDISVVKGEAKSAFSLYQQGLISDKGTILKNPLDVAQYITWTVGITNNKTYIDYRHVEHNGFYEYCRYFEDDTYSNPRASYSLSNYMSDSEPRGSVSQFRMSAAPTEDMHVATKQYVDTAKTEAQQLGLTAATPGQIIKVKTVQDGKPTEWEAVDGGGQPDWNQNDNTKPDYIKNRPLIATNDDAMDLLAEIGIITPITNSNGEILTSSSNEIYSL